MYKDWDDVKDEHVGHTEDDPCIGCRLCIEEGWVDEAPA